MGLGQQYCTQLQKNLTGLHANFPPNRPLALGDYGVKRDDVFQRLGNIRTLGVAFTATEGTSESTIQFKSAGAVDVEFFAKGTARVGAVPAVNAGLDLKFTRENAVFFNAAGCTLTQVDDIAAVGEALAALLAAGRWDSGFYVVTSLVQAASTTAVVSSSRGSEVGLEASSDLVPHIDLADASLKLRIKRSRSTALEIVTANGQTPLMQLSRLRGLFSKVIRPEAALAGGEARPFVLTPDDEAIEALVASQAEDGQAAEATPEAAVAGGQEIASAAEFRPEAAPSAFEVDRAISAYIPLLEACYALANQQPVAIPPGYTVLHEIRVSVAEAAAEAEMAEFAQLSPEAQEAVVNDAEAMEAIADPEAFGYVVREDATGAVLVCLRGTQTPREWLANFTAVPNPYSFVPDYGWVHLGFERMYRKVRASIRMGLAAVGDVRVTALGHSLGGAMATLAAVDIRFNMGKAQVDLCTLGGPRTGKVGFRRNFNRDIPLAYRVTNQFDVVPNVPSFVTGWNHVGEEIEVDGNVDNPHSLAAYLEGLRNVGRPRECAPVGAAVPEAAARVVSVRLP
ncbi:hypothetical protein [Luteitalea sp.]|jgi:hypothetical protein|uniref:lipase family protein n=1 Tax=Luteitalea sp. TaxID=2004800 RepID=UPI0037CA144D